MPMKRSVIPNWTYLPEYRRLKKEIHKAITNVLESGTLILGKHVSDFENAFAKYSQTKYAIGVGNGTDALIIALKALGVGPGDEVITVPNTAIPTASSIIAVGAKPVFVDVLSDTLLMDASKLKAVITKKTKVILPVHLYGQMCDMDEILAVARRYNKFVLEDCAQSTGASWRGKKAGSIGDISTFSFYPTKIIGAYGDGGMITTNNKKLADKVRMLRIYGTRGKYYSYFHGYNSRLDELQAAILHVKLKKIEQSIKMRQNISKRYNKYLKATPLRLPVVNENAKHVWHLYVVRSTKTSKLITYLEKHNIGIKIHYPWPLHTMAAFRHLGYKKGDFPVTERAAREIFSLPLYPELTDRYQKRIAAVIKSFFASKKRH